MGARSVGDSGTAKMAVTLTDAGMPGLFTVADQASIDNQKAFFRGLRAELVLLTLAAVVGLFSAFDRPALTLASITYAGFTIPPLGVIELAAGALILIAFAIRIYRFIQKYDNEWYEARAAAESAKSLAWRYAMGGRPFPKNPAGDDDTTEAAARTLLLLRLEETLTDVANELSKRSFTASEQITPAMQTLRAAPLDQRQAAYRQSRIDDQAGWYGRKSEWNRQRALAWHWAMLAVEFAGAAGSVALAVHWLPFSPQGVVAAVAGAIISWTQSKRYNDLYASYRVSAAELTAIGQGIASKKTEPDWAAFVDEAEEACSREHRLWRATRDE